MQDARTVSTTGTTGRTGRTGTTGAASGNRRAMVERARLARVAVAALLAVAGIAALSTPAAAQGEQAGAFQADQSGDPTVGVRIRAQRLADGRTEFALQHDPNAFSGEPFTWGEPLLPARRFFPTEVAVGRWLVSSQLTVSPAEISDVTVRIVARRLADDRIEFAVQQQLSDGAWGERVLPARRFFPANAAVGRWLVSSPVTWNPTTEPTPPATEPTPPTTEPTPPTTEPTPPATEPTPPATARFTAVDSGAAHACGLRSDGTVTCWGSNDDGQSEAPAGQFTALSAGTTHSCGLRSDGTITCWGGNENDQSEAPAGQFTAVSAGGDLSCGLRSADTAVCWGEGFELLDTELYNPPLLVRAVSAAAREACGLLTDDSSVLCVDEFFETNQIYGEFTAITSGGDHHCGLRTNGTVTCWGDNSNGQTEAPAGRFRVVSAGGDHSCGLRSDGTVTCWGDNRWGQASPPAGVFTTVSAGGNHSCGLRSDGTVTCWGRIN